MNEINNNQNNIPNNNSNNNNPNYNPNYVNNNQPPNRYYDDKYADCNIHNWNWGAAFNSIIWGIANKTYLPFLMFIPFFGIFWWIVCGIKGNEWAWKAAETKGMYNTSDEFWAVQKSWNRAGIAQFVLTFVGVGIMILFYIVIFAAIIASGEFFY